jgi:hypothetical protein
VKDTEQPVSGGAPPLIVRGKRPSAQPQYFRRAVKARNAYYAEPDISVNPMFAWNHRCCYHLPVFRNRSSALVWQLPAEVHVVLVLNLSSCSMQATPNP